MISLVPAQVSALQYLYRGAISSVRGLSCPGSQVCASYTNGWKDPGAADTCGNQGGVGGDRKSNGCCGLLLSTGRTGPEPPPRNTPSASPRPAEGEVDVEVSEKTPRACGESELPGRKGTSRGALRPAPGHESMVGSGAVYGYSGCNPERRVTNRVPDPKP